jgi:hypothetical protein
VFAIMPDWAATLLAAGIGFLGAGLPAWMQIRHERSLRAQEIQHERSLRAQEAASSFLSRLDGVIDAVGYALRFLEAGGRDDTAIHNAIHLSGELSVEVGRALPFLPNGAAPAASAAFEELRSAAILLRVHLGDITEEKASQALQEARIAYNKAREHRLKLIEYVDS